jgi:nicotinamide riboside kinase
MERGLVISLVGAESTGKTTLARSIAQALQARGERVGIVEEYLREFCAAEGRTPRIEEQRDIAEEQTRRIRSAAAQHAIVIADTSALMIAVYSDIVFGDTSLYPSATAAHAGVDLTLLTALDLPWQADGLQRDGPHVREPVDALVRRALDAARLPYAIVAGAGARRFATAMQAVDHRLGVPSPTAPARWKSICERCGEPGCERHGLAR